MTDKAKAKKDELPKSTLYKKYADGEIRSLKVNDRADNVSHMLSQGFFLTEEEAKLGRVFTEEEVAEQAKVKK